MKIIITYLFLFVVCSELFAASEYVTNPHSESVYTNITVSQCKDTILAHINDPRFVILDVRTAAEYAVNHLGNGVNIDYNSTEFEETLLTLDKNKVYLIHCASGNRSGKAFTIMQNLNFQTVYNMIGGMGAWISAGFQTTTFTSPVLALLSDCIIDFKNTIVHKSDSMKFTITNAANDILFFSEITDLSGTKFSSNFDTTITLAGARDYSFYLYYSPETVSTDSIIFCVKSNGGLANFVAKGSAISPVRINQNIKLPHSVFYDQNNKQIIIKPEYFTHNTIYLLYDVTGKLIISSDLKKGNIIDYSRYKNGIYFLKLFSDESTKTYKLPLISN